MDSVGNSGLVDLKKMTRIFGIHFVLGFLSKLQAHGRNGYE